MKIIEIYCERELLPTLIYMYWAWTIQDAIDLFKAEHPNEKMKFAHYTDYSQVTKQFYHESKVPTRG